MIFAALSALLALGSLVYLVVALVKPEAFR